MTTFNAAIDENIVKITTFQLQCESMNGFELCLYIWDVLWSVAVGHTVYMTFCSDISIGHSWMT